MSEEEQDVLGSRSPTTTLPVATQTETLRLSMRVGPARHRTAAAAVAVAVFTLACAPSAGAQARAGLERAQENAKREVAIRIAKGLDDCAAVPLATVDILRHGDSIINYEEREYDSNVNRSLLGTASGALTGTLGLPFNPASVTAGGYRNVPLQLLSREELDEATG